VSYRVMEKGAFDAVVSAHHEEILRYLRRVIGHAGDAEDVSQETFLRAYRAYGTLPADANVRAWLFAIATNLAKNHLRSRLLTYRIFPSPLGNILIAQSELGISTVEYLERKKTVRSSRLMHHHEPGVDLVEGGEELEPVYRDLMQYLDGRLKRFEWPLDLRLVRGDFHRSVLEATKAIPYGAVASYAGLAREVGKASAARAVGQALRSNPLPIVIPCHRVVGSSGALTGYAGSKVGLKERLLALEGVPTTLKAGTPAIQSRSMYVAYPGIGAYCLPSCSLLEEAPPAPVTRFATREDAEGAGNVPCGLCRPDLHPIGGC